MSIAPITSAVTAPVTPTTYASAIPTAASSAAGSAGGDFASSLASSIDGLQSMQATSSELAVKAVSGDLADVHDYTIASTEAAVAMELTVAIRNKAVDAFSEIMRMQA